MLPFGDPRDLAPATVSVEFLPHTGNKSTRTGIRPLPSPFYALFVSARAFVVFMAVLALIGLLGFGLIGTGNANLAVGDEAPDAELARLDGEGSGSIADYRGEWVLVNFWASWCAPCREESPTLQRFSEQHRDDVVVLGIDTQDLSGDAMDFVDEFDLTYPMLRDPDSESPLSDDYGATGLPESFLVDPEGEVAMICSGPLDDGDLEELVLPLVSGRAPQASDENSICLTA
jgi:cytochrome c biogenesis protein CcmG/thiol:disulfide interchange protein DsbE